jgi:Ca-activated chloride channel family protein
MRDKARLIAVAIVAVGAVMSLTALLSAQVTPVYQVVVGIDPVQINVAVTDRGKAAWNLTREDFEVLEDGQPQQIRDFETVGMPYSILLMVDRSGKSEKTEWPKFILSSVDIFLRNLRGPDRLAVAGFDDRVAVLIDWRPSKNGNIQKVMLRKSDQPTRFFEAVDWAAEEMEYVATTGTPAQPGRSHGRRGVIVFTDGRDQDMYPQYIRANGLNIPDPQYQVPPSAEARFNQARQVLAQAKIPFYFVALDTDRQLPAEAATAKLEGWMKFLQAVRTRIENLAEASGGRAIFPKQKEDLLPLYEQIQRDLGSAYQISYTPQRAADGQLRRIEVRVRNSDLQVFQSHDKYVAR